MIWHLVIVCLVVFACYFLAMAALFWGLGVLMDWAEKPKPFDAHVREAIDAAGINAKNTAVLRANYIAMSDQDRTDLEEQFQSALALFNGIPHTPGTEGDTR